MAQHTEGLVYKDHPLRRVGNMIYYGSMADPYIILMQVKETKKEKDLEVATKVSVELQRTGGIFAAATGWSSGARRMDSTAP